MKFPRVVRSQLAAVAGFIGAVALVVGATVGSALPAGAATASASSAAGFAAAASPLQNKVLDAAVADTPGAVRVSPGAVEEDNGRVIVGVTSPQSTSGASATSDTDVVPSGNWGYPVIFSNDLECIIGYFCAWGAQNMAGICWMYVASGTNIWLDWGAFSGSGNSCGDAGTLSYDNFSTDRVWREQYASGGSEVDSFGFVWSGKTGSGGNHCISPAEVNYDAPAPWRTYGWIQMTTNENSC